MSNSESPSDPSKDAAKAFYNDACTKYAGAWSNSVPWFMEALQGEIFDRERLFDRIIAAHDKAKKTVREDMDGYCTDGSIRVYTKIKKVPDDIRGTGDHKINFGGDETYRILEMTTQSLRFFVILEVSKYTKKVGDIHIRVVEYKGKSFPKFNFDMIRYRDSRDSNVGWNKTNCKFICSVRAEIGVVGDKIVNTGYRPTDTLYGWQQFNWWHNYFQSLEYCLGLAERED